MWMLREGKRHVNFTVVIIGILLMTYSWFTSNPLQDWGIGIGLCALAYRYW